MYAGCDIPDGTEFDEEAAGVGNGIDGDTPVPFIALRRCGDC